MGGVCQNLGGTREGTQPGTWPYRAAEYDEKCREIEDQRSRIAAPPAPLFAQQQSALVTLVSAWDTMTADARKQVVAAIFVTITASAGGVDRLEPHASWRAYVVAAIP